MSTPSSELKYWLGFNLVEGIGTVKLRQLLDRFGSAGAAWEAPAGELRRCGLDRRAIDNLLEGRQRLDLEREMARLATAGIDLLTWGSPAYPPYLGEISHPPPLLYMRGELAAADQLGIAIVGTRRLTSYGRQMARELAAELVRQGLTIVSGLARGIDTIVHRTALELGGRTVAVLGSGLDEIYPPENRELAEQIVSFKQGVLLTEYPLGTRPQAKNFPPRNRIISGISLGTLVIEGDVKSGSMITARFALEQNRDIFAVPGNVNSPTSSGPNWLIQQGARLVTCAADILEELNLNQVVEQKAVQRALPETAEEAALLPHLTRSPRHVDTLARAANLPSALVSSTLSVLELKGVVEHVGSMKYALRG